MSAAMHVLDTLLDTSLPQPHVEFMNGSIPVILKACDRGSLLCLASNSSTTTHFTRRPLAQGEVETLAIASLDNVSIQDYWVQYEMQVTEFTSVLSAACSYRTRHSTVFLHTARSKSNDGLVSIELAIIVEASHDHQQP